MLSRPQYAAISVIFFISSFTNTPTVLIKEGSRLMIFFALSGSVFLGLDAKIKPSASAPRSAAIEASS